MKVGLVQFSPVWESKNENMEIIDNLFIDLEKDTSMIIFPEMTLTGFTMNSKSNGEEIDGLGIKYFIDLAARTKVNIICGIIEKEEDRYFNSLYHFDSMGLIKAIYKKVHPFSLADEDKNYSRGTEIVSSSFNIHKIGLSICYDLRFPELYRLNAREGAELMINIANWPVKRIEHWNHLLKSRAIENQCYMIGVNRIGEDPFHSYCGKSAVYGPMGEVIVSAGNDEGIIYADIDFKNVKELREKFGFLNDIKLI